VGTNHVMTEMLSHYNFDDTLYAFQDTHQQSSYGENLDQFDNADGIADILFPEMNITAQPPPYMDAVTIPPLHQLLSTEPVNFRSGQPSYDSPRFPSTEDYSRHPSSNVLDALVTKKRSREQYEYDYCDVQPSFDQLCHDNTERLSDTPEFDGCDEPAPLIAPQVEDMFTLISGFTNDTVNKVSGGKDNREPLPRQTVRVNLRLVPKHHSTSNLLVKASIMGFNKNQEPKVVLGDVGKIYLSQNMKTQHDVVELGFDNIVVTQSSHNHGQRLFVRFSLMDISNRKDPIIIGQVDTKSFQTITRRGKQKQKERKKARITGPEYTAMHMPLQHVDDDSSSFLAQVNNAAASRGVMGSMITLKPSKNVFMTGYNDYHIPQQQTSSVMRSSHVSILSQSDMFEVPTISKVEPSFASCRGGQLIKIHINDAMQYSNVIPLVLFDRDPCRRVISFDGKAIMCEAPSKPAGFCTISVSFDNMRTFVGNSSIGVDYIAEPAAPLYAQSPTQPMTMQQHVIKRQNVDLEPLKMRNSMFMMARPTHGETSVMSQLLAGTKK